MELLKALRMPFQPASLLFVAVTSGLMSLVLYVGGIAVMLAIPALALLAIFFTQFTFTLIDDAVNGKPETATASIEMLSPWGDMRCWVHPLLTMVIATGLLLQPQIPKLPVLAACAFLFPASLGAIALSGNALDAVNPFAMVRIIRGLGPYYLLAVLWPVLCVAAGTLLGMAGLWSFFQIATVQLLFLASCAFIGGAVYMRRVELGFEPLVSPERKAAREEQIQTADRQHMIDGLFNDVRMRRTDSALASARQWLEKADSHHLPGDVRAILAAGATWTEKKGYIAFLLGLAPVLIAMRQPGLAFATVEAGLAATPGFTLENESEAIRMIRFALQTGRKRLAATLLANFMARNTDQNSAGAELLELRAQLEGKPQPS